MSTVRTQWVAFRVEVPEDAADAVASFLADEGAPGVLTAVWDSGSDDAPPPGRARLEAHVPAGDAPRLAAALERYLDSLGTVVPAWAGGRVEQRVEPAVDWDELFRAHHRPVRVGERLLVVPPWEVPPADGRIVLVVEPGMAFGTGQHATTRACLEEIEALVASGRVASALDVGTGSGVLAAALARLGVPRVVALDCDPAVLAAARTTLRRNGAGTVRLLAGTPAAVRARFDLVVANLLADALVEEAGPLSAAVSPGGALVVSGILAAQAARVAAAYPGWRVSGIRAADSWRTLRLVRGA